MENLKARLDRIKQTRQYIISAVVLLIENTITNLGIVINSIVWYSRISPWFGYAGKPADVIQEGIVPCFILPIVLVVLMALLKIRAKRAKPIETKSYIVGIILIAISCFVCFLMAIIRSSNKKCNTIHDTLFNIKVSDVTGELFFNEAVVWKKDDKKADFLQKMIDATSDMSIAEKGEYLERWFRKRCVNPKEIMRGFFIIFFVSFILMAAVIAIDNFKHPVYQSLDVQFERNDGLLSTNNE